MAAVDASVPDRGVLGLAAVAHLSRYRGTSREHTESDLRVFFGWCQDRQLAPLDAQRNDLELYLRWMQDVRRPAVPPESPTLGLTHLQFEALLTAARQSGNQFDFALVCLLGLRIFETVGTDIDDLGEEHGHRVLRVRDKGGKVVLVPLPPAVSRAVDRAAGERFTGPLLLNQRGARMDRHAATRRLRHLAADAGIRLPRMHPHMLGTPSSPRCSTQASTSATSRSPPVTPTQGPPCVTTARARISTDTRTTSSPRTWHLAPDGVCR